MLNHMFMKKNYLPTNVELFKIYTPIQPMFLIKKTLENFSILDVNHNWNIFTGSDYRFIG